MIHKQQLPEAEYKDMRRIFHIQICLLLWILCRAEDIELERAFLEHKFNSEIGHWFCGRIWRGANRTKFGESVASLLTLAKSDASQAKRTATAICNDIKFDKKWDCAEYGMKFPGLPEQWKQAVHDFCIPFYENWLRKSGYKSSIFGIHRECLGRKDLLKAYRPNSNGVCCYCDGPLGDVGKTKEANDCEHFFPKSKFPHLCLHPCNLFVSCIDCNEIWKMDNAPMGVADPAGLYGTYHPQLRPGIDSLSVNVDEDAIRSYKLTLNDNQVVARVESLNSVLDLDSRWTNSVNERLDANLSELISEHVRVCRNIGTIDEYRMEEILDTVIKYREDRIGHKPCYIREIAVLKYQKEHQIVALLFECV